MRARRLVTGAERSFVLVFAEGDEVIAGLLDFARREGVQAARLEAIGAFSQVTLGFFDMQKRDYKRIPLDEQVEVVALLGNIALQGEAPKVHAHVTVATADGLAHGGHLLAGRVRPTLEVMLVETPAALQRRLDEATGLALLSLTPDGEAA